MYFSNNFLLLLDTTQLIIPMNYSGIISSICSICLIVLLACQGEDGPIGPAGADGNDGTDGNDGANGLSSLVNVANESAGDNCENGGIKVDVGIDNNANGLLDSDEILSTSYVCNGIDGNNSLTSVTSEPAGSNCESGGTRIDSGLDTDNDGMLDDTEITATAYVCNGVDSNTSLIKTTNEPAGDNCENGGIRIDSGIDSDGDGILDDIEIATTAYVCNGTDGNNSLTKITNEEAGEFCENGGIKIDSGVDEDGDGTLDDEEIDVTRFVCNGVDGGYDEQIRLIMVMEGGSGTTSTAGIQLGKLIDFDKNYWVGVDSIVFVANIYSSNPAYNAYAELYDATNNAVISNSTISTNSTEKVDLFSSNIYEDLPNEKIDLSLQLRTENKSSIAWKSGSAYIFLFRN